MHFGRTWTIPALFGAIGVAVGVWVVRPSSNGDGALCFFADASDLSQELGLLDGEPITLAQLPIELRRNFRLVEFNRRNAIVDIVNEYAVRRSTASVSVSSQQIPSLATLAGSEISDDELEQYFKSHPEAFRNVEFQQVRQSIKKHIEARRTEVFLSKKLADLHKDKRLTFSLPSVCGERIGKMSSHAIVSQGNEDKLNIDLLIDYSSRSRLLVSRMEEVRQRFPGVFRVDQYPLASQDDSFSRLLVKGIWCVRNDNPALAGQLHTSLLQLSSSVSRINEAGANPSALAATFETLADDESFSSEALQTCLADDSVDGQIDAQWTELVSRGLKQTPAIVINGWEYILPEDLRIEKDFVEIISNYSNYSNSP